MGVTESRVETTDFDSGCRVSLLEGSLWWPRYCLRVLRVRLLGSDRIKVKMADWRAESVPTRNSRYRLGVVGRW